MFKYIYYWITEIEKNPTIKKESKNNEFLENKLSELKTKRYFLIHQLTDLKNERKKFEYDLISNTRILCTTLNSSGSDKLKKMHINFYLGLQYKILLKSEDAKND